MKSVSRRLAHGAVLCAAVLAFGSAGAAEVDPAAVAYKKLGDIPWVENTFVPGTYSVTLTGDPTKPGLYIQLIKWTPHHMSHPHFHPNDRYITVLSGTWWVGTGTKFDPELTVAMPAGTVVTHFAGKVHFDGAKDEDAIIEVVGMGPATVTNAEVK
jgi:hypothetical protein